MNSYYSRSEQKTMLCFARKTIESKLKGEALPDTSSLPEKLKEERSCFVTLHSKDGSLRGCIGNIGAFEPLADNIVNNAVNAAFCDPRFPSLGSLAELESLGIEISVLTPAEPIASPDEFIVGEHGIILQKDGRSAVFLPQVAPEQGWDTATTLSHLSMKAGLSPDAWKQKDASFLVFKAIVFSEKDISE